MTRWEKVRHWGELRGIDNADPHTQFQRVLQEVTEIHDALIKNDDYELQDATGDAIVTLINFAKTKGWKAEECLDQAFNEIERRKGITMPSGDFIKYANLDNCLKDICDEQQGNEGSIYFKPGANLKPEDFKV